LLGSETSIGSVRGITGIFPSLVPKRTLTTTFNRMLDLITNSDKFGNFLIDMASVISQAHRVTRSASQNQAAWPSGKLTKFS
jgi:hypothetical protein